MVLQELSPDEKAYHETVLALLAKAKFNHDFWLGHIQVKYDLTEGDVITPEGRIQRSSG
jgi:hypothetical protein